MYHKGSPALQHCWDLDGVSFICYIGSVKLLSCPTDVMILSWWTSRCAGFRPYASELGGEIGYLKSSCRPSSMWWWKCSELPVMYWVSTWTWSCSGVLPIKRRLLLVTIAYLGVNRSLRIEEGTWETHAFVLPTYVANQSASLRGDQKGAQGAFGDVRVISGRISRLLIKATLRLRWATCTPCFISTPRAPTDVVLLLIISQFHERKRHQRRWLWHLNCHWRSVMKSEL